jgi:hypothetical protein
MGAVHPPLHRLAGTVPDEPPDPNDCPVDRRRAFPDIESPVDAKRRFRSDTLWRMALREINKSKGKTTIGIGSLTLNRPVTYAFDRRPLDGASRQPV